MHTAGPRTTTLFARSTAAALLLAGMLLSPAGQADWYLGAKTGPMMVDGADSDPTNAGVILGREWTVVVGDFGIEAEVTKSVKDGRVAGQDFQVDTQGLYAVLRTAGPIYLIGKAGVVRSEIEDWSETESAYGAGLGIGLGLVQIELEYARLHKDIDFVSLGLRLEAP